MFFVNLINLELNKFCVTVGWMESTRNKALDNAVEWNTVLKEAKGICPEERTLSILLALLLKQRKVTVIKIPSEGSSTKTLIHFGDHQR
jgi:hypothetical protein